MFLSRGRGAEASAPPVQDAFREVFQSRLLARLTSKNNAPNSSRLANSRAVQPRSTLGKGRAAERGHQQTRESTLAAAFRPGKPGRISATGERNRRDAVPRTQKRPESQTAAAGLGAGPAPAMSQPGRNQTGPTGANPPPALREIMAFLQSLPGGTLKIPPEQAPAVTSALLSAGLPQEEANQLLSPADSQDKTLSAADLLAAWERASGQGPACETVQVPGQSPEVASQSPEAQEMRQTPGYRALWERLTLPESLLPTLRLALARLGSSPEAMARLEEGAQGQGIPLTRVWEILQTLEVSPAPAPPGDPASSGGNLFQSALLGAQPVTGKEMEEWRQVLLKAGLQPEVVEQSLGRVPPTTQEELKTTLLALAPTDEPPPALDPKPLFLPPNLQVRPLFWQNGKDRPELTGNGGEEQGRNPAPPLAAMPSADSPGETLSLPSFSAELQGFTQGLAGPGAAPLSNTSSAWRLLSPEIRESLWNQLQSGVVNHLGQGENRVTLSLNPPELGRIELTLNLSGQELAVTAVATRPEVAEMATLGVPQLLQALAQQGLVLTQFQVRLQGQPERQVTPVFAGAREKGSVPGGNLSTSSRRRSGEVDRFV